MARIAGVDIPREKRAVVSLTYIYGIGSTLASHVCEATGINEETRVKNLTNKVGRFRCSEQTVFGTMIRYSLQQVCNNLKWP